MRDVHLPARLAAGGSVLARVAVEGQRGVVVQMLVLDAPEHELGRRRGDRRADVNEVQRGVVALENRVAELRKSFEAEDFSAYWEMNTILNDLRDVSVDAIDDRASQRTESEARLQELELSHGRVRALQSGMNIFGLMIVLLKDLPIWRRRSDN